MSEPKAKLFLIDGHALAYRSYFAFINANLSNSKGFPTGSLLGFANAMVKLLETENPTHIAVAWDTHAPTFRHEMDENYKANRPPQPDELQQTIPLMKEMVTKFGFANIEKDGFEADDIIGTIAYKAGGEGAEVFMVTPDKDFMQLITDRVKMYKPQNNGDGFKVIDREGVEDYFGVPPEKVIDVLAIIGDTSDNIPGVPGIGKKGAPKLIQEFGSLEAALEAAPGMKAKRAREGLTENREQALLSKKMIVIETNVPDTVSWETLKWDGPQLDELSEFFLQMEFKTLARKFGNPPQVVEQSTSSGRAPSTSRAKTDAGQGDLFGSGHAAAPTASTLKSYVAEDVTYRLVKDAAALQELAELLAASDHFCFDTETTATNAMTAELVGIAFSVEKSLAWYVSIDETGEQGLGNAAVKAALSPLFLNDALKIAHNYKYDYTILKRHGYEIKGKVFDTMIAAYLIDSNQRLSMDLLSERYLNYAPISISLLLGKGKNQKTMREIPVEVVYPYACEDADVTLQLY